MKISLITHNNELFRETNTGQLVSECVPGTRVIEWSRTQPDALLLEDINNNVQKTVLVFPHDRAHYVNHEVCFTQLVNETVHFVLIDATWREARKIYMKSSYLHHLDILICADLPESDYALRRKSDVSHLCTAEMAVYLLKKMQCDRLASNLQTMYSAFNQR